MSYMYRRFARFLLAATAMGTLIALPLAVRAVASRIDIEPEGGSFKDPVMAFRSTACSGEKCIGTEDKGVTGDCGGYVKCTFNVDNAGTYVFWARSKWVANSTCGDSFYIQMDDGAKTVFGEKGTKGSWTWVQGPKFQLSEGTHTLWIHGREDGALMDKVVLHTNTGYTPQGKAG
jgi:hypothetical protein